MSSTHSPFAHSGLIGLFVFLLAFALRALWAVQWAGTPYGATPFLDAQAYDEWATIIATGDLLHPQAFYQAPLYPYVLGLFYALLGRDLLLASLLNALFDTGSIAVLSILTHRLYGPLAAAVTAVLGIFFAPSLFYVAPLMKEPLALFLLSLFLFFIVETIKTGSSGKAFASGLFLGLAALTRGNVLLLILPALFLLRPMLRTKKKTVALFLAALFLCVAPSALHNALVSRDFIPISYADGFNFYIGWGPYANGVNSYPPEVSTDPIQEERVVTWTAEKEMGQKLTPSQVSSFWRKKTFSYLLDNPSRILPLLGNKIFAFWNTAQRFDNYDVAFIREAFNTLLSWPLINFWVLSTLAAFGAVALWKKDQTARVLIAFSATYMLSVLLFYVTDRYRLPVIIFLLPLAGASVPVGWTLLKEKCWQRLGAASGVALVFLTVGLWPDPFATDLRAFNWGVLTMLYEQQGKPTAALDALEKGRSISERDIGAGAYIRGSYVLLTQGHIAGSEDLLRRAERLFPNDGIVLYNLGRLKAFEGKIEEASSLFVKGLEQTPSYSLNYLGQASVLERKGLRAQASSLAQKGLALDPDNKDLQALARRTRPH